MGFDSREKRWEGGSESCRGEVVRMQKENQLGGIRNTGAGLVDRAGKRGRCLL